MTVIQKKVYITQTFFFCCLLRMFAIFNDVFGLSMRLFDITLILYFWCEKSQRKTKGTQQKRNIQGERKGKNHMFDKNTDLNKRKVIPLDLPVPIEEKKKKDKKNWVILLLLLIIFLLLLKFCRGCQMEGTENEMGKIKTEDGTKWDGKNPVSGKDSKASAESIDVAGYSNLYLSATSKLVNLINPKGNTVYFKYVILDEDGNILIKTDLIAPDTMVEKDLYSLLEKGEHILFFQISTYDEETLEPCNGVVNQVKTVVE